MSSITMLMLTMTNDNDIASKFTVTLRIPFVFSRIIVIIIRIRPNSKDPLFSTTLENIAKGFRGAILFFDSHCM